MCVCVRVRVRVCVCVYYIQHLVHTLQCTYHNVSACVNISRNNSTILIANIEKTAISIADILPIGLLIHL